MLFDDLVPASGGGTAPAKGAAPSAVGGTGLFEDLVPAEAPSTERGMGDIFTSALSRGWSQNVGLLTEALPALAYSVAGNDQDAQRKLGEYQARLSEIARTNPAVIENFSKIGSLGDAVTYLAEAVGENLPSMVPGIGAGGAGMIAGRALARNAATKAAAGMTGLTAGAIAGSAAQNIPETFADVAQETGEQRPGVALAFGGLKAGLDAIPSVMALKRAFGPAITDKIAGNILKRMGVGAAEQFAGEGATETGQEALDIAASKYVDENREFFTKENALRIADAGLKGGLGGAALGAGTGAIQRPGAPVSDQPPGQDQGPVLSDTHRQYLREMGLSDQAIDEDLVRAQTWAERIATRKADDQRRAGFGPEGDWEGLAEDAAGVASGEMDPGAQRSVGRVAPSEEPIVVTPDGVAFLSGDLGAVEGAAAAGQVRQNVADNASEAFRLAEIKKQKGPAYEAAKHYVELTEKIGQDPGQLVEQTLQIPAAQFQAMPIPARDRLIHVAMEARQAQQPGPDYRVQDTSGEGPTSAAPAPMREARAAPYAGAAENPEARVQPTGAEIEGAPGRAYTQQALGGSERPFPAGQDSSGLDFTRDQAGKPVDPRAAFFEQRAQDQYEQARAQKINDLEREWAERARAREGQGPRYGSANDAYGSTMGSDRFSAFPKDLDKDGNYPVDQWGFVQSTKGGPVRYADQRKAAQWIVQHGNRRSKDQIFEIENHPSGKGFAVRERGRREPPPGGRGPGNYSVPARTTETPGRPSPGQAEGPSPEPTAAASGAAPVSPGAPQPAPDSPRGPAATVVPVPDINQQSILEEARNTTTGPSWFERGLPPIEAPMPKGKRSYTTYWTEWKDAGDGYASRAGINLPRLEIRTPEGDVVVRGWGTDGVEYNEIETGGWPTGERLRQVEDRMQALRDRAMRPKVQGKFAIGSRPSETRAGSSSGNENVSATIQTRPETSQQRAQATDSLRQILRKLAGDKVDVKVVDRIVGDDANFDGAGGFYTADEGRRIIYIAMAEPNEMAAVLRHETIHALRDLGIIGPKDWRTLENQAAGWRKKYQTDKYYGGLGLSQEKLNEEAIAEAYADWVRGQYKPTSVVENVFRQIKAFFEALRNWAQGNGWNTAEDVFGAIEGGGMNQAEFDRTPLTRNNAFAMSRAAIKQQASGVLDMIKNIGATMDRLNNPLVTLPGDWRNYFEMRGMAKGEIQRIQDHLAGMRDLIGLPKAERDAALRFMTTKGAAPSLITDPQKRAKFVEMKQEIVKLGQQLVDAGMLNEATFRANKDSYLPRVYLKFVLDEAANRKGVGTGARVSQQGYLKQRQDIPEDVRKLVYGEIDDPGFLAVRSISVVATDLAKFKLLQQVSDNPDWVANPKDQFVEFRKKKYTPQALKAQADQLRRMVDQLPEDRRAGSLKMALEMEKLANTKLQAQPEFSKDYKQIPDTARYGSLRGLWVRKEIFNDMIGTFAVPNPDPSWAEQVLGMGGWATKATQWWKFGKVVANPPSIARNLMSGMIQSNVFGRVPFAYIPMRYTQAVQEILKNGKHWQAAQKFGIKGSGFAQNESAKIERAFLAYQKQQGGTSTVRNMARFKDMIAHVVDIASDGYQFIESVGKVAVIIDAMERQGLSERDAVILAEDAQFDYSNVSPAVRYLRNSPIGMPFITFSSKVAPQLIKTAATRPWAFGPYLALAFGLPMLTQYMLDIDDDDLERLKKTLPKWAQETGSVYLLPFKDSAGRWHYWNAGYVLPWGQFQDAAHKAYAGKPLEAAKGMGMFGAPLVSLMTAVQTGIDPFTQRPIYNKADPPGRQWRDISLYLWSMAMPPWAGSTGFAKKLHDAALDVPIDKQGNPSATMTQAVSSIFGISLYGLDPDVNRQKNLAQMKYEIDEIKRRRGSIAKDARLKPADKKAYLDEINAHIAEKAKAMAEYARETNVNPKLRVPAAR